MFSDQPPKWLTRCYLVLFVCLPWSVEWPVGNTWSLHFPGEPLIGISGIALGVSLLHKKKPVLSGIAWVSVIWLTWQAVAAVFSTMPLVSWKYWTVQTGHWWVFFAGMMLWPQLWPRLSRVLLVSLAGSTVFALIHHGYYQFRADQATLGPMPFFADHTVYSAVLVLALFINLQVQLTERKSEDSPGTQSGAGPGAPERFFFRILPLLFLTGLALSFSRAAWLSLCIAVFTGAGLYFQKHRGWFGIAVVLVLGAGVLYRDNLTTRLHTDVSSLERLNRYACARRMAADRPCFGFGPGTFQFQYLAYQKPAEMTRISVSEPISRRGPDNFGRGGGAHSEYWQALAETGWPGLLCWLALVFVGLGRGITCYRRTRSLTCLFPTLGLLSFFLHGLVNNFFHDARIAALVWGQLAFLLVSTTFDTGKGDNPEPGKTF